MRDELIIRNFKVLYLYLYLPLSFVVNGDINGLLFNGQAKRNVEKVLLYSKKHSTKFLCNTVTESSLK